MAAQEILVLLVGVRLPAGVLATVAQWWCARLVSGGLPVQVRPVAPPA